MMAFFIISNNIIINTAATQFRHGPESEYIIIHSKNLNALYVGLYIM